MPAKYACHDHLSNGALLFLLDFCIQLEDFFSFVFLCTTASLWPLDFAPILLASAHSFMPSTPSLPHRRSHRRSCQFIDKTRQQSGLLKLLGRA